MKSIDVLKLSLFNTRSPRIDSSNKCDSAYELWTSEWSRAFKELGVAKSRNSDDFVDRELGGLFLEDKAIGFLLYNNFDLTKKYHTDHSYFDNYPKEIFPFLTSKGFKKIMVISYMTIHQDWRKSFTDIPISELLISFCTKRFQASDCDALVGYFRQDRKTNEMFYRHGAVPIVKDIFKYNVPVDFAYITQETLKASSLSGVRKQADFLWNEFFKEERKNNYERNDEFIYEAS